MGIGYRLNPSCDPDDDDSKMKTGFLFPMLRQYFNSTFYVRIRTNGFRIRHIEKKKELELMATEPFSHERMLIGNFTKAANTLKEGLKKLVENSLFQPSPVIVVQPLEKLEGGLTEIEERVLREMVLGVGAREVVVWVGAELTDAEVLNKTGAAK